MKFRMASSSSESSSDSSRGFAAWTSTCVASSRFWSDPSQLDPYCRHSPKVPTDVTSGNDHEVIQVLTVEDDAEARRGRYGYQESHGLQAGQKSVIHDSDGAVELDLTKSRGADVLQDFRDP
ncbi:unnamed protein product [Somion occarium]|uniref:Uncharacterized protein n=1 Tax=Somion occarium TaxID=3059160 RepID=A0ABP1E9Y2_9APHY